MFEYRRQLDIIKIYNAKIYNTRMIRFDYTMIKYSIKDICDFILYYINNTHK